MSQNIRLFPTYSQNENQTTNYCLLILKMLYEENPKFLAEVLSELLGENFSGKVGVKFAQQIRSKQIRKDISDETITQIKDKQKSIPDGEITQEQFSILIETKLGCNFDKDQLCEHIKVLKAKEGQKVLLALGKFETDTPSHPCFPEVETEAKKHEITFLGVSFEQFLEAIRLIQQSYLPKNLVDAISDLGEYFDENNLLPSWKYRLDIVNCARYFDSVVRHKIYTCPAQGGQYNHQRSLYFGTYRNKCVEQIARIEAVVDLESESEAKLVWKNDDLVNDSIQTAIERRQKLGDSWYPVRIFVLGDFFQTNFIKGTPGGMFGSKKYFDIKMLKIDDANDLATKLKGKTWKDYESLI